MHFGGNWSVSNLKDQLKDVSWQQAITKVHSFNTIATLVFHVNYFVGAATMVLEGKTLNTKDELSFDHPSIRSQQDWEKFLDKIWNDAEKCARLIEQLPDSKLTEDFFEKKYGTYYRNLSGIIEHLHYHLGQIVMLKKLLQ